MTPARYVAAAVVLALVIATALASLWSVRSWPHREALAALKSLGWWAELRAGPSRVLECVNHTMENTTMPAGT